MNLLTEVIASLLDVELLNRTSELTEELKAEATKAGWPNILVSQLSVVVEDGDFSYRYPSELKETVELLEFGTEDVPPNPVLRNFMSNIKNKRPF